MTSLDGVRSEARLFRAAPERATLLVLPAMGVNARSYDRLGEQLANAGVTALVMELRGGESSSVRPRPGVDFGYADLIADMVQHLEHLRALTGKVVHVLGHSLGGQFATAGVARWHVPGARLIVIAGGSVDFRAWSGWQKAGIFVGTQLAGVVARSLRYYPGHRLGFGGLQPESLIVEWSNAARTGHFVSRRTGVLELGLETHDPEVLALHVEGDTMAPPQSLAALVHKLTRARVRHVTVKPPAEPKKQNPHFRWMKDPTGAVAEIAPFLLGPSR